MRTVLTILYFLLAGITTSWGFTGNDSLKTQEVVNSVVEKILIQDKQNLINEKRGVSFQNNYIIDIDVEHWIEEQGTPESKILNEEDFKRMSQNLQAFNSRKDGLRLYVIVINDYVVRFETRIDPSLVSENFKWNDLQKFTKQQDAVKEIWSKTGKLINDVSDALKDKGFTERMIYFYSQLKVYEYDDTPHRYKFDRLSFIGKAIEPLQEAIRKQVKVEGKGAVSNIDQAINSIINGTKTVVDGEGDVPPVDCSQSIETIAANTKSIQTKELDTEVLAFAKLIDNPTSAQQTGSRYMIIDQPENFASDDFFTNEVLPDKLAMLAQPGISDYKLYVVFKEIEFVLPTADWESFAQKVAGKSSIAKQSNTILMVVPYFKTVCTGTHWTGMPISKGTGITMAAVYTSSSLKGAMNSALSAPGNSWKANFNQAFKQIPKAHNVYAYSFLWNGDFIQHKVNTQKNVTGYENFNDIVISDDGRYEELKKAETFLTTVNFDVDVSVQEIADEYINGALSAYFTKVETAMSSEQLVKVRVADEVKQSKITAENATTYARWLWTRKTDRATHFNLPNTVPDDDFFYGGINVVTAQEFMRVLDVASFASSFVGLDIIFDSWQAYYAYDKGFYQEAAIAATAVVITGITATELKLVKGLRRAEFALAKTLYNKKLIIRELSRDRVYASFIPIVYKLKLDNILSTGVVSAIQNKHTFLSAIGYARKAEYQSLVQTFEKAVDESDAFKQLINSNPSVVDVFFKYSKQKSTASVDEVLELATIAKELPKNQVEKFIADFGNVGFSQAVRNDPELVKAWKSLDEAGRTGLKTNVDALQALNRIKKNTKLNELKITDAMFSKIEGIPNVSYAEILDDLDVAIKALPEGKTVDFYKIVSDGQRGLVNSNNVWDRRHSWLALKKIKENETFLKNADEVKFEVELEQIDGINNAVPDIVITKSERSGTVKRIIGEIKAGDNVITSNFNNQCLRYFQDIADIRDLRLFRRDGVPLTKQQVIDSWKTGGVLGNAKVKILFEKFDEDVVKSGFDSQTDVLEDFLKKDDSWFNAIFNSSF